MKHLILFEDYQDKTEYINFKTRDMKKDFDYLNNLLFKGEVREVGLEWMKSKTKAGLAVFGETVKIQITTFFKMSESQYLSILAHEMIHIFIHQNNIRDNGDHGSKFKAMMKKLNLIHPEINIKPTEDASFYTVNSDSKKPCGVLLFITDGGKDIQDFTAVFVTPQVINNKEIIKKFADDILRYSKSPSNIFTKDKSLVIEFYKCNNPELHKFKMKRTLGLNNLGFFEIHEGDLTKIREGHLIDTLKVK